MDKNGQYSLSEFYLFLKLGIWSSGNVVGWGFVEKVDVNPDYSTNKGCFVKKLPKRYKSDNMLFKKQLNTGLNLLDLYSVGMVTVADKYNVHNYIAAISECRLKGAFPEIIYYLKIRNYKNFHETKKIIYESTPNNIRTGKQWSPLKKERRVSRIKSSPINSVTRKH